MASTSAGSGPTPGALHSDHINYLILRYLQEHGHEAAATAFHRDWHRPREFRDPEDLPFAPVVARHALVRVVQDGLLYDELSARARTVAGAAQGTGQGGQAGRKFGWTAIQPRVPLEEQGDVRAGLGLLENGGVVGAETGSRPASSGKRKGRQGGSAAAAPAVRTTTTTTGEEFPTPAPKRQRRSREVEEGQAVNGEKDAMDVDAVSPAGEVEEEAETASQANVASETEGEAPERVDSMEVMERGTQTELKQGPKTSTTYWNIDRPGAHVLHSLFNPDATNPHTARTLLTVGENLCRISEIPSPLDNEAHQEITHHDIPHLPPSINAVVTATAWHPSGASAVSAIDGTRHLAGINNKSPPFQYLLQHSRDFGTAILDAGSLTSRALEPASLVLALRFSPNGEFILVVRTNLYRGMVQVFRARDLRKRQRRWRRGGEGLHETNGNGNGNGQGHGSSLMDQDDNDDADADDDDDDSEEPLAWRIFEHQVLDACWLSDSTFLACGDAGLACAFRLNHDDDKNNRNRHLNGFTPTTIALHNLKELGHGGVIGLKGYKWDRVRYAAGLDVAVFASTEERAIVTVPLRHPRPRRRRRSPSPPHHSGAGGSTAGITIADVHADADADDDYVLGSGLVAEKADLDGTLGLPGRVTGLAFQPSSSPSPSSASASASASASSADPAAESQPGLGSAKEVKGEGEEDDAADGEGKRGNKSQARLLAATFEEGFTLLYRVVRLNETCTACEVVARLDLPFPSPTHSPVPLSASPSAERPAALALAWAPGGAYLAVAAGGGVVGVWGVEEGGAFGEAAGEEERGDGPERGREPVVVWRFDGDGKGASHGGGGRVRSPGLGGGSGEDERAVAMGVVLGEGGGARNGEYARGDGHEGENGRGSEEGGMEAEPCLSWCADGEGLGVAVGTQMAVIRFRPPLPSLSPSGPRQQRRPRGGATKTGGEAVEAAPGGGGL